MIKTLFLLAEISFLDNASGSFNFPITNAVRMSFWLPDGKASTFSEIQPDPDSYLEIGRVISVKIMLADRPYLNEKIQPGTEFHLGRFPVAIANGRILEVCQ